METPGLLAAFVAGMLSFLSPCVLPLVPGYLSLMSGLEYDSVQNPTRTNRGQLLFNAVLFVLGFTIVFVLYGAVASGIGSQVLQHRDALTKIAGVLIIAMGLVVAGVVRPALLLSEKRLHVSPSALGPFAAPVMGMAFAFGWTPCIGPILAAVLALAAGRDTLGQGVGLLLIYSVGLGVPFIVMALAFGRFRSGWQWLKRHGRAIDIVAGTLLVIFGALLLTSQLGWLAHAVLWFSTRLGFDGTLG